MNEFWDTFTGEFFMAPPLDKFESLVADKNSRILDFGCGYGRVLNDLSRRGYQNLYGVDASQGMLERSKKEYPELPAKLSVVNNFKTDFETHSFDAIFLISVLTCIPDAAAQKNLLDELKRVLKPGGVLVISDFRLANDEDNQKRYIVDAAKFGVFGIFQLRGSNNAACRHYKKKYLENLLQHDFNIELEQTHNFNSMGKTPTRAIHFVATYRGPQSQNTLTL